MHLSYVSLLGSHSTLLFALPSLDVLLTLMSHVHQQFDKLKLVWFA